MAGWFVENSMGAFPPFLQRNIKKYPEFYRKKTPEQECSSLEIVDLDRDFDDYQIRGHIKTPYAVVPIAIKMQDPIILFSCFDELFVYILASENTRTRLFFTKIVCCQSWNTEFFEAREVGLFGGGGAGNDSLRIKCRIKNLRDTGTYHYNIVPPSKQRPGFFTVRFQGERHSIVQYTCVLCFLMFERAEFLVDHINISHHRHSCEYRDGVLSVCLRDEAGAAASPEGPSHGTKKAKHDAGETRGAAGLSPEERMVSVLKNRKGGVIEYGLKNYKMLIEREYDTQDYSHMLVKHAVADLAGDEKELSVIEEWNRLRIANVDTKGCFAMLLRKFDLSMEIVRLAEVLYKKGVLNSRDILDALDSYRGA